VTKRGREAVKVPLSDGEAAAVETEKLGTTTITSTEVNFNFTHPATTGRWARSRKRDVSKYWNMLPTWEGKC